MDHGSVNKQLEANRALLPKRKKQKFSYASSKDETNRFTKKATPEQLQEIRDRIQKGLKVLDNEYCSANYVISPIIKMMLFVISTE